ncbi:MAG: hypothetical protein ICV83_03110 [Cytophagales bacterium]|nr:hypothetical protein [Cytophagales bacterium]
MKKILISLVAIMTISCKETTQQEVTPSTDCVSNQIVGELTAVAGKIEKVADFFVIQTTDRRYSPCNLPENVKVSGMEVVFDGQEMAIPANVRLVGVPIVITTIQQVSK